MRLVRSWPRNERADRARVIDDADRIYVDNYDYRALVDLDDNVINLDWDIAAHREDLEEFARRATGNPKRPLVAPYIIYPDTRPGLRRPTWPMRRYEGPNLRYVTTGEPTCHLFGFGMVYLPRDLIIGFAEANPVTNFDDTAFASWLYQRTGWEVPITWDLRPVHLNYRISSLNL